MMNKKSKIGIVVWIAFYILLGLVILYALNKAGFFSGKVMASIKEKLFPFS